MVSVMNIVDQLRAQVTHEQRVYIDYQMSLAVRIAQIMEHLKLSQAEFASLVGLPEDDIDSLVHFSADPPLSVIARIEALSKSKVLTWVNTDVRVVG